MRTSTTSRRLFAVAAFFAIVLQVLLAASIAEAQNTRKDRFNHLSTGFPLTGAHEQAKCESCHLHGIFKGTPKDCVQCHGPGTRVSEITMPANHIPTVERCGTCHTTTKFYGVRYDHATAEPGSCNRCHAGNSTAPSKPPRHIATTASCDSCHRRTGWLPAAFDHAQVAPGSCAQCHNGGMAKGQSSVHIPTSAPCDTCHSTTQWIPAARFDHATVVTGTCNQCHDGKRATGQKAGHIPTNSSCDSCHSRSSWLPAKADHTGVVPGTCATCHDGRLATGKSKKPNHIPTTASCDACHRTSAWVPTTFSHAGIAAGSCASCHNGATATGKPANHIQTTSSCDSCHQTAGWRPAVFNHSGVLPGSCGTCHNGKTAAGKTAAHIPVTGNGCDSCHSSTNFSTFVGAAMNHAPVSGTPCSTCHEAGTTFFGGKVVTRPTPQQDPAHPLTGECNACHTVASFGAVTGKPANHIPTTQPCGVCHTVPGDFTKAVMSHQGITGNCVQCHGGKSFAGTTPRSQPATHIPTNGAPCEACHSTVNFSTWGGTPMNHAPVAGMTCASCHEKGRTWFGVTIVTRPTTATHPTTGDCGACHSTTSFAGAANKPANHIPTTQPCSLCHTTPGDYKTYTMNHAGITGQCSVCHGPGLVFATNFSAKQPPATHIPASGIACESCHSPTTFTSFAGTAMNHTPVAGTACATCHEKGKSFFGVTIVTRPTTATHPATGDCGTCHNTTSFKGAAQKPANHIPTSQACSVCHKTPGVYTGGVMDHVGITGNCAQCHGPGLTFFGVVVKSPPATHIPTAGAACEACHSATNFTTFGATAMKHPPVASLTCATCHEFGKSFFGVTIVTRPQTTTHPKTGDCGACHDTVQFKAPTKPANHIPTSQPCSLCHTTSDYSKAVMNHQGIASNCAQCHGPGLSFANVVPVAPPAKHVPYAGAPCEACHAATKFTNFSGTKMNHTPVTSLKCTTCHERGMTWFGVQIVTRPSANHNAGQECNNSGCHSSTTTFSKRLGSPAMGQPASNAPADASGAPGTTLPGGARTVDPGAAPGERILKPGYGNRPK